MSHLPLATDFNEVDFPELTDIFRAIDLGIAAIVASDPAMRPSQPRKRRQQQIVTVASRKARPVRRDAA